MRAALVVLCLAATGCNSVLGVEPGTLDKGMIHIEGKPFSFSLIIDQGPMSSASPAGEVHSQLSHSFALDEDEVTVERFQAWLDAGAPYPNTHNSLDPGGPYEDAMVWSKAYEIPTARPQFGNDCQKPLPYAHGAGQTTYQLDSNSDYPMTCVQWPEAVAFCAFEHKRLPSNAEWQYAAQGGTDGTKAPFTGKLGCDVATADVFDDGTVCSFPVNIGTAKTPSKDGLLDMGGSVREWTWDRYDYGKRGPLQASEADDFVGADGDNHLLRGASFSDKPTRLVSQNARAIAGDTSNVNDVGIRCAKTLFLDE